MASITEILRAFRFTGPRNMLNTIPYTRKKNRLDREYRRQHPLPGEYHGIGVLQETSPLPRGTSFQFEGANLEIHLLAPDLVRLTWSPGRLPVPYALATTVWPEVDFSFRKEGEAWCLSTSDLELLICPDGSLTFQDPSGRALHRQLPPLIASKSEEDFSWEGRGILFPEERVLGLGEQAGPLNHRGGTFTLWNSDPGGSYGPEENPIYMPLPVYLGLHHQGSYLIFYENSFPGIISFGKPGEKLTQEAGHHEKPENLCQAAFECGALRYYFIPGPPPRAIEQYTALTGRPPLPPLWSLGYHQSRWGYKCEQDIREVVAGFQEHGIPLSAIHLDIDYMDGFRVFSIDRQAFPDLAGLSKDLMQQGIRLVTILDPGIKQDSGYDLYREGLETGIFCKLPDNRPLKGIVWPGWSVFPDFTRPEARDWWGSHYSRLLEAGISGFWHDMNEPVSFTAAGEMTLPLPTCHDLEGQGGDHRQAHNLYGLLMDRAGYEALRKQKPERRPWLVSRSGWTGVQRYAWTWTGDSESTWDGLRMTLSTVLGLGLSGVPFSGPDIGGFSGNPPAELYVRWLQAAAFLPFCRTHSAIGTSRREPWVYGEPYTSIIRKVLQLRYRLMLYFYSQAWEAALTGHPLVRPLFWGQEEDTDLWDVEDAFLVGDSLLVAPILQAGAVSRKVRLPRGEWYSLEEDQHHFGPASVRLPGPLEQIPVLVRGGSLLPVDEGGQLALHVYLPEGDGIYESRMYSDAGEGFPAEEIDWRIDLFRLNRQGTDLELSWESEGLFPLPYNSIDLHLHGVPPRRIWVDGQESVWKHDPQIGLPIAGKFKQIRFEG